MTAVRPQDEMACQQAVELVTDYLGGALTKDARLRFEAHLAQCADCAEYLTQIQATIRLTGQLQPEDLTPAMRDDFIALYRRWRSESN